MLNRRKKLFEKIILCSCLVTSVQELYSVVTITNKTDQPVDLQLSYPEWKYSQRKYIGANQSITIADMPYFSRVNVTDDYYNQPLAEAFVNPSDKTQTIKQAKVVIEKSNNTTQVKIQQ